MAKCIHKGCNGSGFPEQNVMIVAPYGVKMETVLGHTQKSRSAVLMEQNVRVVEKVQLPT